ncbi:hypothetical protein EB796_009814 [Bugula neritina]|uniref:Uncharacterized protein n=1 Tax=Bugula neritina TaxID=10212 RepID=A0A7J7JZV3_BUGNE|nr:hypothetical protein EB796_009814 [Bugula neritina]
MNNAKSILELRVSNFEKKFTEEISEEESEKFNKELKQLRQLLPDIVSKIEDVADESVNAKKAETEVKAVIASQKQNGSTTIGFGETSDSSSAATIATKKANDISNLVRKRKPEVQPAEGSKKVKLESTPTAEGDKENGVSSTDECSKISS